VSTEQAKEFLRRLVQRPDAQAWGFDRYNTELARVAGGLGYEVTADEIAAARRSTPAASPIPEGGQLHRVQIEALVQSRPWFHQIEVAPGIVTPGIDNTPRKAEFLQLPESFAGKTVLDVGAYDGYFSFLAEQRGAARVVAYDHVLPDRSGFALARAVLGSRVEHQVGSVYDLTPERVGQFDVVLFLGVIYHLRHPLLALERLHAVCKEVMYVESQVAVDGLITGGSAGRSSGMRHVLRRATIAELLPGSDLNHDPTNWWAPSIRCLEQWLRTHGFDPTHLGTLHSRAAFRCLKRDGPLPWYVTNY
jgi:tRNA (mo5U34)-methyltransferase